MTSSHLEKEVAHYQRWRDQMISGIESYKAWLDTHGYADIQQSLRIYDLIESLKNDRMTLAFLAEFSRGKTELINAMFFSDFKQRLLPSDVGRTTMCPTEILHDPAEPPYIRLLPIETRKREESVSALKRQPVEWIKIALNIDSHDDMMQAMRHLIEVKSVGIGEAKALGLWDENNPLTTNVIKGSDSIEIPAWRHAIISYPHPLLKSGLVVLDTPGLNALGTEPELTLSMIPNAHAVLFLLAMDTGVTKSDLEVWQKFVQTAAKRRIAVLNKIDLMWDELKPEAEIAASIERQIETTASLLHLPRASVLAISAQKALLARVRGNNELLKKSGVLALEELLAAKIIPAKQDIMRATVQREIGSMVDVSRLTIDNQLAATQAELKELVSVSGKNRELAQTLVARLEVDRANYKATIQTFQTTYGTVMTQGVKLMQQLNREALEKILNKDREFIEGAWTTAGLWKNMQSLFGHFTETSNRILTFANQIKDLVEATYTHFHEKFGFGQLAPPPLNLEKHTLTMTGMQETARQFCHDPINMMTEKHFLLDRFYESLVAEARQIFELTRYDVEKWLKMAFAPLNQQLQEYEKGLTQRIEHFKKIRDNLGSIQERIQLLEKQQMALNQQRKVLVDIKDRLAGESTVIQRTKIEPVGAEVA